mgnify:FL=1
MRNNIINISNEEYYLDIDAIIKWCLSSSNMPFKESEINEGYDLNDEGDIQLVSKVIRETKTNNSQDDTIRYDFIKLLLAPFLSGEISNEKVINDNFSHKIIFNSLIEMKFLIKINKK